MHRLALEWRLIGGWKVVLVDQRPGVALQAPTALVTEQLYHFVSNGTLWTVKRSTENKQEIVRWANLEGAGYFTGNIYSFSSWFKAHGQLSDPIPLGRWVSKRGNSNG